MSKSFTELRIRQLDQQFDSIRSQALPIRPKSGWIATIREALGMTQGVLAKQLSITQQSVAQLEKQEASDRITIAKLREVAASLDCDVHVLVIPRESLAERIEKRAEFIARRELDRVITTMTLEDQRPSDEFIDYTIKKRVEELKVAERKRLWQ